jgi:hypothetical protein
MGDWMTVNIVGTCGPDELDALCKAARVDIRNPSDDEDEWGPLSVDPSTPSLCGLDCWPAESMCVVGNCFERDFTPDCVAEQLRTLVRTAPSLALKVHCGGPYEAKECVKTVTVAGGAVTVGEPEITKLPELSTDMMTGRIARQLLKPR